MATDPALPVLVPGTPVTGEVPVPETAAPAMPLAFAMSLTAPAAGAPAAPAITPEAGAVVTATPVAAPAVAGEELATAPVPGAVTGEPVAEEPAATGAQPTEGKGERGKSLDSNGSAPGNGNGNAYGQAKEQGETILPDGTARPVRTGEGATPATPAVPSGKADGAVVADPKAAPATPATPGKPDAAAPADAKTAPAVPAVSAQPATPAAPATPAQVAQAAVPLHRAAQTVGQLLQVATDRGITHARLALKPAELGGVEIRLQTSSAGVTAQVIADSPAATRLLLQAGAELRRSLEDAGVNLLSLDVSTQGEDSAAATAGFAAHAEARERQAQSFDGRGSRGRSTVEAETPDPIRARTLELPGGVLVDVFA